MAKVVVSSLSPRARKAGRTAGVASKRVSDGNGQGATLHTLDAHSRSFGADLQYVFERNVAKARRENKRITGASDVAPAKR